MSEKPIIFTDLAIRQLQADPVRRREIPDAVRTGLRLRITPGGHKSFAFRYWLDNEWKICTLGTYPKVTLKAALDGYKNAVDDVAHGRDPAAVKRRARDGDGTVGARVALYDRLHVSTLSAGTQLNIRGDLAHLTAALGKKQAHMVERRDVQGVIDKALARGESARLNCYKNARAFFQWLTDRGDIDVNPMEKMEPPGTYTQRDRVLDDAELVAVWSGAETVGGSVGAFVKLLILTGCRRDEIAYLVRSEVNGVAIRLPGERTKNGQAHTVPITPMIRAVLDSLPKDGGPFVVTNSTEGLGGHSQAKKKIDKAVSDVPPWTFHDLRRTFGTGLAKLGVPIQVTERCLNHVSGTRSNPLVKIYQQHDYAAEVKAAFENWSLHVESLVSDQGEKAAA